MCLLRTRDILLLLYFVLIVEICASTKIFNLIPYHRVSITAGVEIFLITVNCLRKSKTINIKAALFVLEVISDRLFSENQSVYSKKQT